MRKLFNMDWEKYSRHYRIVLFLSLVVFAFAFQGSRGLWDPDEGRYTNIALEMLYHNDFIHPMHNPEQPHYTKPPLTYWLISASIAIGGKSEWSVRSPYAIAFVLTVLLIYVVGLSYLPDRPWLPAFIYATSFLPYLAANIVTTDTLLVLWETLAVTAFIASGAVKNSVRHPLLIIVMWVSFGLAFLTKGPPGLLPLLPIIVFVAWEYGRQALRNLFPVIGILGFLVVGFSWYIAVVISSPELFDYFIKGEFINRVATNKHHRYGEWYGALVVYVPAFLVGSLPWGLFLTGRVNSIKQFFGSNFRRKIRQIDTDTRFLLMWLILPMFVFILARSRMPLYVLPLFVPLSLLIARAISPRINLARTKIRYWLGMCVLALLVIRWLFSVIPHHKDARALAEDIRVQTQQEYRKLIFVNHEPRYGLSLYINAEIGKVYLTDNRPRPSGGARKNMAAELAEKTDPRLFFVEASSFEAFKKIVHLSGKSIKTLGQAQEFTLAELVNK